MKPTNLQDEWIKPRDIPDKNHNLKCIALKVQSFELNKQS